MPIERSDFTHDVYIFKREGVRSDDEAETGETQH